MSDFEMIPLLLELSKKYHSIMYSAKHIKILKQCFLAYSTFSLTIKLAQAFSSHTGTYLLL